MSVGGSRRSSGAAFRSPSLVERLASRASVDGPPEVPPDNLAGTRERIQRHQMNGRLVTRAEVEMYAAHRKACPIAGFKMNRDAEAIDHAVFGRTFHDLGGTRLKLRIVWS